MRPPRSRLTLSLTFVLAAVLAAGCASRGVSVGAPSPSPASPSAAPGTPSPGSPATTSPVTPPASTVQPLVAERKYLRDWFAGTPVTIDFDREQALVVDVPLAFAFDAGKATPKPALVKVLDHVATSLRRASTTRFHVTAPVDVARPDQGLADRRAKAVGDYVLSRGVNAVRLASAGPEGETSVRVRIVTERASP